ncbi:MAG: selenide, water dikinase SelD [Gemmatimonadaceae bacterium]|nr:selenide, water dikinase SelD [Gemmatimonadaceae bacterium]
MGPADLSAALAPLPQRADPRILVGRETFDDAGVYRLTDELALVQTVDFFAPIVDDPYDFGRVAAANALSDVYAMGGTPLTALSVLAFPTGKLPLSVMTEIVRGGQDTVHAAGAHLIGGHTVTDDELKFGLSITGSVHPDRILTNANARVGDHLVLTKGIGTGLLATQGKRERLAPEHAEELIATMTTLNRVAAEAAQALELRCATDVTGFGLVGHASHIARASQVQLRIDAHAVPVLPGARGAWRDGARTGGAERNLAYVAPLVDWGDADDETRALFTDPQTSGGLLAALPEAEAEAALAALAEAGVPAWLVGHTGGAPGRVRLL